jgi:hypothetical protein
LSARRLSWSRPYFASVPVRKFSTTTSDRAARVRINSCPSVEAWLTVTDRLLRLQER